GKLEFLGSVASGGFSPVAAVTGEFTGDGVPELLVANAGNGAFELFRTDGGELVPVERLGDPDLHPVALAVSPLDSSVIYFVEAGADIAEALAVPFGLPVTVGANTGGKDFGEGGASGGTLPGDAA